MMITEPEARKIARYLFMHKWLAAGYSEGLEDQLTREIWEATNLGDEEETES